MVKKQILVLTIAVLFQLQLSAQERLEATKIYKSGESFLAPLVGIKMTIPEHWIGYLPQDNEIFLMNCDSAMDANAMFFSGISTLKKIKSNWKKGFPLAPGLSIVTKGKIENIDGVLSAEIEVTNNASSRGFVMAKCGDFGYCISVMMYTPSQFYPPFIGKLNPLVDNITFVKPTPKSELEVFDWQKEMTGKYIFSSIGDMDSKKESKVWLYLDGTFKSKIKRTGLFKGTAGNYKGTKRGTYLIYNKKGKEPAKLVLFYKKMDEVTLPLEKKENQLYINNQVFYISFID
jgi:hypothetical protein